MVNPFKYSVKSIPFLIFFLYNFFWGGAYKGPWTGLYFYLFLTQTIIIITYINIIIIFENTCLNCSQEKSFAQKLLAGTPALFTPIVVSL